MVFEVAFPSQQSAMAVPPGFVLEGVPLPLPTLPQPGYHYQPNFFTQPGQL